MGFSKMFVLALLSGFSTLILGYSAAAQSFENVQFSDEILQPQTYSVEVDDSYQPQDRRGRGERWQVWRLTGGVAPTVVRCSDDGRWGGVVVSCRPHPQAWTNRGRIDCRRDGPNGAYAGDDGCWALGLGDQGNVGCVLECERRR